MEVLKVTFLKRKNHYIKPIIAVFNLQISSFLVWVNVESFLGHAVKYLRGSLLMK